MLKCALADKLNERRNDGVPHGLAERVLPVLGMYSPSAG